MKISTIALLLAAVVAAPAGAQQLAQATPRAATDTTVLPFDRVVAVVGDKTILWTEVLEQVNQRRAQGILQVPADSVGQMAVARQILQEMIDEEVLVQRALADTSIKVTETEVNNTVEQQIKRLRGQFKTDAEYNSGIKGAGFGTPEEYRRWLTDQARRRAMEDRLITKLRQDGKIIPVPVSEEDVNKAFNDQRGNLPKKEATVTFRQIIIPAKASEKARAAARAKADSLLGELKRGSDFEAMAKRESMDPTSRELGGDIGWTRLHTTVPEFDRAIFSLPPGILSPVVETTFGFHIIRVDRVQPGEVKARHILIRPRIDSADVEASRARADSVLGLWKKGANFDSLVAKYHDPDESKVVLEPFERTKLPDSYQKAFANKGSGDFVEPFSIEDKTRDAKKFVIAQIINASAGGEYTVADFRTQIRDQLSQERAMRRLIDTLRKQAFVSVRL